VAVAGADLVRVDAEVVGQLEPVPVSGQPHEDVDGLLADRKAATFLEPERLVEGHGTVDVRDAVAGVDELHARILRIPGSGETRIRLATDKEGGGCRRRHPRRPEPCRSLADSRSSSSP